MSLSTLREQIDSRFFTSAYIHADARQSYRHWWAHLGYLIDMEYEHILNPNRVKRRYMQRYVYHRPSNGPEVSHTVVLPTGENITHTWLSAHGYRWGRKDQGEFREKKAFVQHGIEKKERDQAREDWRERKGFRRDKALRKRCHRCCGKWMKKQINRENRRANKALIYQGKDERIPTLAEPRDTWRWD